MTPAFPPPAAQPRRPATRRFLGSLAAGALALAGAPAARA